MYKKKIIPKGLKKVVCKRNTTSWRSYMHENGDYKPRLIFTKDKVYNVVKYAKSGRLVIEDNFGIKNTYSYDNFKPFKEKPIISNIEIEDCYRFYFCLESTKICIEILFDTFSEITEADTKRYFKKIAICFEEYYKNFKQIIPLNNIISFSDDIFEDEIKLKVVKVEHHLFILGGVRIYIHLDWD